MSESDALGRYTRACNDCAAKVISVYSTSFGAAVRMLGRRHRVHVRNIYALVRIADELVDGVAARACVIPLAGVAGRSVTTLEGLATERGLHPVQQAFVDAQAAQCGYCLNGMLMMTVALLAHTPQPTEREVRQALSRNLCRCGTHVEIVAAALRAAELMAAAGAQPEA